MSAIPFFSLPSGLSQQVHVPLVTCQPRENIVLIRENIVLIRENLVLIRENMALVVLSLSRVSPRKQLFPCVTTRALSRLPSETQKVWFLETRLFGRSAKSRVFRTRTLAEAPKVGFFLPCLKLQGLILRHVFLSRAYSKQSPCEFYPSVSAFLPCLWYWAGRPPHGIGVRTHSFIAAAQVYCPCL